MRKFYFNFTQFCFELWRFYFNFSKLRKNHTNFHTIRMFSSVLGCLHAHLNWFSTGHQLVYPLHQWQTVIVSSLFFWTLRDFSSLWTSSVSKGRCLSLKTCSKLCFSNMCSFWTSLLIIPIFIWSLTVQILPSLPGKVSATFQILHFSLGMLSSDIRTTPFPFSGISSLIHFLATNKIKRYSEDIISIDIL